MIDRAIGVAGVAATIIFGVLLVAYPKLSRKIGFVGLTFGVVLLAVAGVIFFLPDDGNAQAPPVVQGPGITANSPPPIPRSENATAASPQLPHDPACKGTGVISQGSGLDVTIGTITGFNCGVQEYGSGNVCILIGFRQNRRCPEDLTAPGC